jgi:hypothetical protein
MNDLDVDVILHGFMLQISYITVFRIKRLNNLTMDFMPLYYNLFVFP